MNSKIQKAEDGKNAGSAKKGEQSSKNKKVARKIPGHTAIPEG